MRQTSPSFFALPVDIYDAIFSSQLKYPMTRLRELAVTKGLVVSPHLTREDLCMRIARLPFSYNEFLGLSESLKPDSRKPRSEATNLDSFVSSNHVQSVYGKLKEKYPTTSFSLKKHHSGTTVIKAEYDEIDHGQTRLKQRSPKEASIEISAADKDKQTSKVISSSTPRAQEILASLIALVEDEHKLDITPSNIDLSTFTPEQINTFFMNLANSIPTIDFSQAKSVKVQRADEQDDNSEEEIEDKGGFFLNVINNASVDGENILESPLVKDFLKDNEYYIHTLRWETEEVALDGTNGARLMIEIKATPPREYSHFQFDVLSYRHRNKKNNEFVKKFSPINNFVKAPFIEKLRKRAFEVYQEISDEVSVE